MRYNCHYFTHPSYHRHSINVGGKATDLLDLVHSSESALLASAGVSTRSQGSHASTKRSLVPQPIKRKSIVSLHSDNSSAKLFFSNDEDVDRALATVSSSRSNTNGHILKSVERISSHEYESDHHGSFRIDSSAILREGYVKKSDTSMKSWRNR